jgi:hypothetical protein
VWTFRSKALHVGKLAASCNVSGGPVYKVAYATQLLGVELVVRLLATNISKEALLPGGTLALVLHVDPQVFWGAPRITKFDEADDAILQSKVRQYWGR